MGRLDFCIKKKALPALRDITGWRGTSNQAGQHSPHMSFVKLAGKAVNNGVYRTSYVLKRDYVGNHALDISS